MYLTDKPEKCRRASALAWLDSFTGFSRMQKLNWLPLLRHARTHALTHARREPWREVHRPVEVRYRYLASVHQLLLTSSKKQRMCEPRSHGQAEMDKGGLSLGTLHDCHPYLWTGNKKNMHKKQDMRSDLPSHVPVILRAVDAYDLLLGTGLWLHVGTGR